MNSNKLVRLGDVEEIIKKWLEKEEGKEKDVEFAKWVYSTRKQILEELLSSLKSLPLVEPLQFTMYDYRGPWASDESKQSILEQHNRKILEHYHLPPSN